MAYSSLQLFTQSPEAQEGITAFNEKRPPEFAPFRAGH
jgi:naphthoate synthase